MDIRSLIIGFVAAMAIMTLISFILDFRKKKQATDIGTLYIHEGRDKDTYSFAFNRPLEEVKNVSQVLLKIEVREAKSAGQLIEDMESKDGREFIRL